MRVEGYWHQFRDGITRPVIEARVQTAQGDWLDATFLAALAPLAVPADQAPPLGGVGGQVDCLFVQTPITFARADGKLVTINGPFGVFTKLESSDISVLGRDVTNNFDVIYSFPKREVLLLAAPHGYVVQMPF